MIQNREVDPVLRDFVERELLPGLLTGAESFWSGLADAIQLLAPRNEQLLTERDRFQAELDASYHKHGAALDVASHRSFLASIGYLRPRKAANLQAAAPEYVVTGNIGCMVQIGSAVPQPVLHLAEIADWATGGPQPAACRGSQRKGGK